MVELGFGDVLSLAQTIGIIGTMVLTLYFSKRQIQSMSIDQQTRVLNDLDETGSQDGRAYYRKTIDTKSNIQTQKEEKEEIAFVYYVLWICSHAYAMRERNVLNDNEWTGWLLWMRNCFKYGTIREHWKQIQSESYLQYDLRKLLTKYRKDIYFYNTLRRTTFSLLDLKCKTLRAGLDSASGLGMRRGLGSNR
jgi:hypothetical protein